MALHDSPPHAVTLHSATSSTDDGGGVGITYTSAQSAVPCSIKTLSAAEIERFAQMGIQVSHTVAVLSSALSVTPARGWKIVTDDRSQSFHIEGIRHGRSYGSIPAFHYFDCRELL